MIDVKKVHLAYMEKDELIGVTQEAFNEFMALNNESVSATLYERRTLQVLAKHLQRYKHEDERAMYLINTITSLTTSITQNTMNDINARRAENKPTVSDYRQANKNNMCNAKMYPNKYNK